MKQPNLVIRGHTILSTDILYSILLVRSISAYDLWSSLIWFFFLFHIRLSFFQDRRTEVVKAELDRIKTYYIEDVLRQREHIKDLLDDSNAQNKLLEACRKELKKYKKGI